MSTSPPHVPTRIPQLLRRRHPPGQTQPKGRPSELFLGLSLWMAIATLVVISLFDVPVTRMAAHWAQGAVSSSERDKASSPAEELIEGL